MAEINLEDYVDEWAGMLKEQLARDRERCGNVWRRRTRTEQELRTFASFDNYYDMYKFAGQPIPWLKVAGLALIAWVRENKPETLHG